MKRLILLCIVLFLIGFGVDSYAQGVKIGAGGGLSLVMSPDVLTNDPAEGGVGFSTEYHFGVKAKLSIPLVPVVPVGFINYHMLSGSENVTQNILTVGAGVEFSIIPGPLSPYAALDLQYNSFGDTEIGSQTFTGYSRTGLGIGAGIEFSLIPMLDLDLSAKYNMLNLMGKEEGEETIGIVTLNLTVMLFGI